MSLINDALKRAKQAQQQNPPATPELQFRPVEPGQQRAGSPLYIVGAVLGLVVLVALGGLLLWAVGQQREAELQVAAKAAASPVTAPAPVDPPPAPHASNALASADSPEEQMTNALPAAIVEPPQPEFKLQGIFFNPRSPSAVVNGRTVYVGDKVSGFRVFAITPETVSLGSASATNVLSLSE